jgi:RNA-directed DNA polymerase
MTSFDRVNHQRLLDRIAQRVADRRLLAVVRRRLTAGVAMPDGTKIVVSEGTPQGGTAVAVAVQHRP